MMSAEQTGAERTAAAKPTPFSRPVVGGSEEARGAIDGINRLKSLR
jgi:hypothetical protein